jgi:hypothetical protein
MTKISSLDSINKSIRQTRTTRTYLVIHQYRVSERCGVYCHVLHELYPLLNVGGMVLEMEAHVAVKLFHGPIKLIFSVALFAMTLKNVTVDIRHRALECTRNRTTGTRYVGCSLCWPLLHTVAAFASALIFLYLTLFTFVNFLVCVSSLPCYVKKLKHDDPQLDVTQGAT